MEEESSHHAHGKLASLENQSKDEIITKYKNLLALLKKAKSSKDEAVAKVEKEKADKAKLVKSFEDEKTKYEDELEALKEIVASLTEHKIDLVTKAESFQRQLHLQLTEVDSLKKTENIIMQEKKAQDAELEKLKLTIQKQQKVVEQMKEERNKYKQKDERWNEERDQFLDKISYLEEQMTQTDLLKKKFKTLVEENSNLNSKLGSLGDLTQENKELQYKAAVVQDENKALTIVQSELISQKTALEERLKVSDNKITETETLVVEYKEELDSLKSEKLNVEESNRDLIKNLSSLKSEVSCLLSKNEELNTTLRDLENGKGRTDMVELENCLSRYKEQYDDTESALNRMRTDYETVISDCKQRDTQIESLSDQLNIQKKEYKELEATRDNLNGEIQNLRKEVCELKISNEQLVSKRQLTDTEVQYEYDPKVSEENVSLNDKVKGLELRISETDLEFNMLQEETHKLVSLINNLFCLSEEVDNESVLCLSKSTYSTLERIVKQFTDSNLDTICEKCSSALKQLIEDITLLSNVDSDVSSDLIVAQPVTNIICSLKDICLIISKFLKFNVVPELILDIDQYQNETGKLGKLIKDTFNCKRRIEEEKIKLLSQIEVYKYVEDEIVTKNTALETAQEECNRYLDKLNEVQKLQLLQDEAIKELTMTKENQNKEINNLERDNMILNENTTKLEEKIMALSADVDAQMLVRDRVIEEKSKTIFELEEQLKSEENSIQNYKAKINSLESGANEINMLLASKDDELKQSQVKFSELNQELTELRQELERVLKENSKAAEMAMKLQQEKQNIIDRVSNELHKASAEKLQLAENVQELEREIASHLEKKKLGKTNTERVSKENTTLRENISTLETELCNIKRNYDPSKYEEMEINCKTFLEKISSLETELGEHIGTKDENKSLANKNKSLKDQNSSLNNEISSLQAENASLKDENINLTNNNVSLNEENAVLKDEVVAFQTNIAATEKHCDSLLSEINTLTTEAATLKQHVSDIEEKLNSALKYTATVETQLKDKEAELLESVQSSELLTSKYENCLKALEDLQESSSLLKKQLTEAEGTLNQSLLETEKLRIDLQNVQKENEKLQECKDCYIKKIDELREQKENFEKEVTLCKSKLSEAMELNEVANSNLKCLKSSVTNQPDNREEVEEERLQHSGISSKAAQDAQESSQYSELLDELNKMNEVLRERGERISRLEELIKEKSNENELLTNKLKEVQSKLTQMSSREEELVSKQEELKKLQLVSSPLNESVLTTELEARISVLERENELLKRNIHNPADSEGSSKLGHGPNLSVIDNQCEALSTSTISKAEEGHRMKELEDTFEERYMKLKSVAIKLKKKLAEQTAELKAAEEAKRKLTAERDNVLKKANGTASKNVQILQSEIDRLQDVLDAKTGDLKQLDKHLVASAQEISDLKLKLAAAQEDSEKQLREIKNLEDLLSGQEDVNQSLRVQVSSLEKRLEVEEKKSSHLEENQRLSEEVLRAERESKCQISKELEDSKQELKKCLLMDLEMKDYERTIADLTNLVTERDSNLAEMKQQLENEVKKGQNLGDQIYLLRSQVESETERAEKLKKTVTDYKGQLDELRQNQESQIVDKERDKAYIERLNQELEKLKLSMAELSSQASYSESTLRRAKDAAEQEVESLEESIEKLRQENLSLQTELEILKKEFEGYKVRAQSVLRRKSRTPEETVEQVRADREQLSAELESAHIRTHQLQSEFAAVKAEVGFLSSERDRLLQQTSAISEEMTRKDVEYQEQLRNLEKKLESKTTEYQQIIASMSSQSEAMHRNYKTQAEGQREAHIEEVQKLQAKLEDAEEKIWQLKNAPVMAPGTSSASKASVKGEQEVHETLLPFDHHHLRKHGQGNGGSDELKVDISNMIREAGEGSEWVEPTHHRSPSHSRYSPPPLDQLINNPFPPQQSFDESMSVASAPATEYSTRELSRLENKITSYEDRIKQLSTLLVDSEAENAKLVQLSDALKEEIRRAARNESREKHLENNEYMKNVVLKFLLLRSGDEKARLIPVLKTILQLSPEETKQLSIVAKGDDDSSAGSQGWGNYLHLWSGR